MTFKIGAESFIKTTNFQNLKLTNFEKAVVDYPIENIFTTINLNYPITNIKGN